MSVDDNDEDITPEAKRSAGRHHDEPRTKEYATPLPPPPPGPRSRTPVRGVLPLPAPDEAAPVAALERGDVTGRIDLAMHGALKDARVRLDKGDWWKLAGLVSALVAAIFGWWLSVRDGLQERPTRDEVRQSIEPLKQDVRGVERALDRLTGAIEAKGKGP